MELLSNGISRISQLAKRLFKVKGLNHFQLIVGVLTVFLFSSCKEYLAIEVTLTFIPELLFGIFIAVVLIVVIIGAIINFLS